MVDEPDVLDLFFAQAREIVDGERSDFTITPHQLEQIATQTALRNEFDRRVAGLNNPELKQLLLDFVRDMADLMEDAATDSERKVELIDRAGLAVAASITAAGVGATVAAVVKGVTVGALAGPLGLLAGGLAGLILAAWGRDRLKRNANRSKSWARKFRRLIGKG